MQVVRIQRYPLALCIVELASTLARDVLVNSEPVLLGNWFHANFVKHDQLANRRNSPFTREGWLMILGIPLRLKTRAIIEQATNLYGEFIDWHYRDRVLGRVLVKARYKSVNDIPAKLVLGDATAFGGLGQSWTFHVFVLNGMPADILPGDEDLLPIWQMLPAPQDNNAEQQNNIWENFDFHADDQNDEEFQGENHMAVDIPAQQPQDSLSVNDYSAYDSETT
jgi:hypothetical protein